METIQTINLEKRIEEIKLHLSDLKETKRASEALTDTIAYWETKLELEEQELHFQRNATIDDY